MIGFLNRHPWIYVVLAFGLLIGGWTTLVIIASKHRPQEFKIKRENVKPMENP
jgi:hypothetical protein